jgi:hypothetical protein
MVFSFGVLGEVTPANTKEKARSVFAAGFLAFNLTISG